MRGVYVMPTRRMSAREARANFSDLLGLVYYTKEAVIVEKKGRPFAVVISPEQYERLRREEEEDWAILDQLAERNADKDPKEVEKDVTAAVEAVRQELYEGSKRTTKRTTKNRR